ncbi:MAG: ATP-binding cassette domain-containing protein [Tannerella sp.]|jgi:NitT/TauT family transport system ATP-binding protein|nr:ATP-binding cassette domain-containing protein [Tannerella sp.]
MIKIKNISKSFHGEKGNLIPVLSNFSLGVEKEKFYTIVGPNGCGKSTLLNIVAGVIPQDSGEIVTDNQYALRIGYVWQDYRASLLH